MKLTLIPTVALALGLTTAARAQFTLSELLIDAPGTDDGQEFIEIRGPANTQLTGYYFLAIEGDGTAAGVVDQAIDLSAYSTGSNGLLLIRDTSAVLSPAPDAATSVVVFNPTPDIENGTNTFVLGFGTAPAVNTDLDTDNDGTLDAGIPGFTVVDAVSGTDGGAADLLYAAQLGGTNFAYNGVFTPDCYYRIYSASGTPLCWTVADVTAPGVTGPYSFDFVSSTTGEIQGGLASGYGPQALNPGSLNEALSLCSDVYGVSSANGGSQVLTMDAGTGNANNLYLFVGSFAGTTPGIPLTPTVTLPLNFDAYLSLLVGTYNTPILTPSIGTLDAAGRASCTFTLPSGGLLPPDTVLDHAALVVDLAAGSITFATTPARVVVQL
ncbi:MAG: hypothetical protein R3F56_19960 [Planctomycetota bacterium]